MTVPAGWAEFNDANAIFRGRMVAAKGTFSGTFSSDNVEAVQELNIRDGAVSAYYGFNFAALSKTIQFTIPAQPLAGVADIIVPMQIEAHGENAPGTVKLYKNGSLYRTETVIVNTESIYNSYSKAGSPYKNGYIPIMQVVRFIDFDVSPSASTTYQLVATDGSYQLNQKQGFIYLSFLGNAVVGCRKR